MQEPNTLTQARVRREGTMSNQDGEQHQARHHNANRSKRVFHTNASHLLLWLAMAVLFGVLVAGLLQLLATGGWHTLACKRLDDFKSVMLLVGIIGFAMSSLLAIGHVYSYLDEKHRKHNSGFTNVPPASWIGIAASMSVSLVLGIIGAGALGVLC